MEDHPAQIFRKSHPSLFVGFKVQGMPLLHFGPLQLEVLCRPPARMMIPSIGEQDPADVQKQASNCSRFLHRLSLGIVSSPIEFDSRA